MAALVSLQRVAAEGSGTAFPLSGVTGSRIMEEMLAGGNTVIALLGSTIETGAILVVLTPMFQPISGAHSNSAVTIARCVTDRFSGIRPVDAPAFILVWIVGAVLVTLPFRWLFAGQPDESIFAWFSGRQRRSQQTMT